MSELLSYERLFLEFSHGWRVISWVMPRHKREICMCWVFLACARCPLRPLPRFDDTDSTFSLINWCSLTRPSLVGYPPIFGRIRVGKSARIPSMLLVAPSMTSRILVGIGGGFVLWEKLSNLLKNYMYTARLHYHVVVNCWLDEFMDTLGC